MLSFHFFGIGSGVEKSCIRVICEIKSMTGSPFVESVYSGRICPHEIVQNEDEPDFEQWYRVLEPVDSELLKKERNYKEC